MLTRRRRFFNVMRRAPETRLRAVVVVNAQAMTDIICYHMPSRLGWRQQTRFPIEPPPYVVALIRRGARRHASHRVSRALHRLPVSIAGMPIKLTRREPEHGCWRECSGATLLPERAIPVAAARELLLAAWQ